MVFQQIEITPVWIYVKTFRPGEGKGDDDEEDDIREHMRSKQLRNRAIEQKDNGIRITFE